MAVDQLQEWRSDPVGRHRFRLYTDGRPTGWVSDGNAVTEDPLPPAGDQYPVAGTSANTRPFMTQLSVHEAGHDGAADIRPAGWYRNAENPDEVRYWDGSEWSPPPAGPAGYPSVPAGPGHTGSGEPNGTTDAAGARGEFDTPGRAAAATVPADWYPDPSNRTRLRYWDGHGWTEHVLDEGPAYRP